MEYKMSAKQRFNYTHLILTAFVSIVCSTIFTGYLTKQLVAEHSEIRREFRVIDITALTQKLMEKLENDVRNSETQLTSEMIEFIAKQEARKMYAKIAKHNDGKDIILPKNSVLYVPQEFDVTQAIADQLSLGDVGRTGLNKIIEEKTNDNGE